MKKVLKAIGIVLGGLVVLILGAGGFLVVKGGQTFEKVYDVPQDSITIPTGEDAIAKGERIATIQLCVDCHHADLSGGEVFLDDPNIGTFASPNLTSGEGGVGAEFTDQDWINAIRYGVDENGHSLIIMPSETYHSLSDEDLGYLIAYVKSVPPVDNTPPARRIGPMGRLIVGLGQFPLAAALIEQLPPPPEKVDVAATVEYGEYLAPICMHCHGENLAGTVWPQGAPDARLTPNLTPGGELLVWSEEDFIKAMRTGETPTGRTLDTGMPWKQFTIMTDDELKALFLYLKSLPKTPSPTPTN